MKRSEIRIDVNDLVGKSVGKLTVIKYIGSYYDITKGGKRLRHFYICKCRCGNEHVVQRGPLKNNIVHSCGCLRRK